MNDALIWTACLDGAFRVAVDRLDANRGLLTISRDGERLAEKEVPLAYGAQFGPDVDDVSQWEEWAAAFVDAKAKG